MNSKLVLGSLGSMLLLMTMAMALCLALGALLPTGPAHSNALALEGWLISMAITGFSGLALRLVARGTSLHTMLIKDAMGIVGLGWLVCSVFAALPYLFCEPRLTLTQAGFEAVSGLTTTGATVFTELEPLPKTILLWRSSTQWMGGMGILAVFVLVSARSGVSGKSLFHTESSMHAHEDMGTRMKAAARWLWTLYIALTLICGAGLWALGMTAFQAINHALTTASTGGFGTETASINGFSLSIQLWMTIFMFLCAVSFPLHLAFLRTRNWRTVTGHEELRTFAGLVLLVFLGIVAGRGITQGSVGPWGSATVETAFTVVSMATSSGFVVGNYDTWPTLCKGAILLVMVIGGCAGSTAGGLKAARVVLLVKILRAELEKAFRPNLVVSYRINGRPAPAGVTGQLLAVLTSAMIASTTGFYLLIALEPNISTSGCITAVITCLGNTGPAFSEFGPTDNFAGLKPASMILLSLLMILGRLEYVAVLVLLVGALWRRY